LVGKGVQTKGGKGDLGKIVGDFSGSRVTSQGSKNLREGRSRYTPRKRTLKLFGKVKR